MYINMKDILQIDTTFTANSARKVQNEVKFFNLLEIICMVR